MEQHGPVWWYHSDHLGSTSYITDIFGKPVQYIEYLPFGEVMVEQSTNNILENVYKFNAKELDAQTGYYYYGARYYDPGASIFLSVDPLAEEFPAWTPYHYVHNNPMNLIDPTGMSAQEPGEGDPVKQPQKILNIKVYGEDRSLYYDGEAFSFGTGGYKFYSENGTRGDLTLLKGNSGEGESIDADGAFALASYAKAFASGSMYKTFKEGAQFIGNLIDLISKGKDIKDGVEKAIGSDASKGSTLQTTPKHEPLTEKVTVQRIDYRATKPFGNNGSTLHRPVGRDTTVVRGNEGIVKKLDTRDSLRESIKVKKYNGL
ncbi:RHS repeat-associated core domain-containing protein [Myroides odoratus]|uniref:RHS repeat domain-containing protein n=1 Tax=Myroides odoratus TaxID=256 RepID=UPI00333EBABE